MHDCIHDSTDNTLHPGTSCLKVGSYLPMPSGLKNKNSNPRGYEKRQQITG